LQVPPLVGPVVDPLVPTKEPQEPTTMTPAEIIYHRRVQVLDRAGRTMATVAGGGAVRSLSTTVLMTVEEMLDALSRAQNIAYRPPGG
jgi:hypothetical protein